MQQRPFSQACENNKVPILEVLRPLLLEVEGVLELASGSGQHAFYFSQQLPHLQWQATDLEQNLAGIEAWRSSAASANFLPAVALALDGDAYLVGTHISP